ncbi:replication-relaxation family protein [Streptomyces sp. NPDC002144]
MKRLIELAGQVASEVLARPLSEMGGTAHGAARSGAPHAMAVNETIIATTRTTPERTRPVRRVQPESEPAASLPPVRDTGAAELAGIGTAASWSTEVVHHLPADGRNRSAVQVDAVLLAPEGVPGLLVEIDNCTETADVLAAKFDPYRHFFRLKAKASPGGWRSRCGARCIRRPDRRAMSTGDAPVRILRSGQATDSSSALPTVGVRCRCGRCAAAWSARSPSSR